MRGSGGLVVSEVDAVVDDEEEADAVDDDEDDEDEEGDDDDEDVEDGAEEEEEEDTAAVVAEADANDDVEATVDDAEAEEEDAGAEEERADADESAASDETTGVTAARRKAGVAEARRRLYAMASEAISVMKRCATKPNKRTNMSSGWLTPDRIM